MTQQCSLWTGLSLKVRIGYKKCLGSVYLMATLVAYYLRNTIKNTRTFFVDMSANGGEGGGCLEFSVSCYIFLACPLSSSIYLFSRGILMKNKNLRSLEASLKSELLYF